jgi:hypothetical protein
VQPLDVGVTQVGAAPGQVVQRGHSIIIASRRDIIGLAMSRSGAVMPELTLTVH